MIDEPISESDLRAIAVTHSLVRPGGAGPLTEEELQGMRIEAAPFPGCYMSPFHVAALLLEIARLKRGDFTEEEFQNLCHHFDENDETRFKEGCAAYQKKLFGNALHVPPEAVGGCLLCLLALAHVALVASLSVSLFVEAVL